MKEFMVFVAIFALSSILAASAETVKDGKPIGTYTNLCDNGKTLVVQENYRHGTVMTVSPPSGEKYVLVFRPTEAIYLCLIPTDRIVEATVGGSSVPVNAWVRSIGMVSPNFRNVYYGLPCDCKLKK